MRWAYFFQGQAPIANAQSIGINKHIYLLYIPVDIKSVARYMTCILISSTIWSMPTTVDVSLHDLIVFTSPFLQFALGQISEEDLSIF